MWRSLDGGPRGSGAKCATKLGWVGGLAARKDHVFIGVCGGEYGFTAAKIDIVMGKLHVHPVVGFRCRVITKRLVLACGSDS